MKITNEDVSRIRKTFKHLSVYDIAPRIFGVTAATFYQWLGKGIPEKNTFACIKATKILDILDSDRSQEELLSAVNMTPNGVLVDNADIELVRCIINVEGIRCGRDVLSPTQLCREHFHQICAGATLVDVLGHEIDCSFISDASVLSAQRCKAMTRHKHRCNRYSIDGSKFCAKHLNKLKQDKELRCVINGIECYVDLSENVKK